MRSVRRIIRRSNQVVGTIELVVRIATTVYHLRRRGKLFRKARS